MRKRTVPRGDRVLATAQPGLELTRAPTPTCTPYTCPGWQELVGMVLSHARDQAANMAGERIVDAVITVPPFFTQFERQAVLDAAELAGLKVLRRINVDTAVALHYGITRKFNATPEYHIFYDMGASSTKVPDTRASFEPDAASDTGSLSGLTCFECRMTRVSSTHPPHRRRLWGSRRSMSPSRRPRASNPQRRPRSPNTKSWVGHVRRVRRMRLHKAGSGRPTDRARARPGFDWRLRTSSHGV